MMFRLLASGLLLLASATAPASSEPHPETQLLTALDDLTAGRVDEAWSGLDRLVKRQPNFRLAQLFYGELLAARAGAEPARLAGVVADPELEGLKEEARLRLQQWREPPPPDALPDAILQLAPAHKHAVVVDLAHARLYLLENSAEGGRAGLRVARNYYASIGKNGPGKQTTGDHRTPIGIYTILSHIPGPRLPDLYGAGAFPVDYPNPWDRRRQRTGSGIWLHGVPRDTFNRAPRSSEGCVTLANDDLMSLAPHFVLGATPVILSDSLNWRPAAELHREREQFLQQLEDWRARWSARDTDGYLAHYAEDFETDGMNMRAFGDYKRRVNAGKSYIDVQLTDVDLFRYPGEPMLLARFTQHYRSDNLQRTTRKEQYWRLDADGRYRIVKEDSGR